MKFNTKALALAAAATTGLAYVICAVFVALFPALSVKILGAMLHLLNLEQLLGEANVTLGGFLVGLLPLVLYAYLGAWLFGWVYNRVAKA